MLTLLLALAALQESPVYTPRIEAASDEGRLAMEAFQLMDGFTATLWAEEPMLANPVCLYVTDRGELYVAESFRTNAGVTDMREHRDWLGEDLANETVPQRVEMMAKHEGDAFQEKYAVEHERVRLLRDTDGDGRADEAVVFADGFNDPADGIGAGLLERDGKVWYTCIPKLWQLEDIDGDGHAEQRRVLSDGYGVNIALLGHDLHGLRIGPDRKLYFSCGDRGFHVETEDGTLEHAHAGAVLRCSLDGSGLEVFATGLRNPQELVFDDYGNLFTGDNNSDGGDKARWVHVVEGGDSGWRYSYQWLTQPLMRGPWNDEKLWHPWHDGQAAYIVPPVANLANGPSGLTVYPGTGFGDDWRGRFFLCEFRGDAQYSGILSFDLQPKGASFALGEVERFVWKTLATDADFGPDGALWITDWVHGWTTTGKGRVYRVTRDGKADDEARLATQRLLAEGPAGMAQRSTSALQGLLAHADRRVRQEAQFALSDRGNEGARALFEVARDGVPEGARSPGEPVVPSETIPRLHGVFGLGILAPSLPEVGPLLEDLLLRDADPELHAKVLKVLGDSGYRASTFGEGPNVFEARLADASPRVRLHAALGLWKIADARSEAAVLAFIDAHAAQDPVLRHAGVLALDTCSTREGLTAAMASDSRSIREAALLVLRRREDPRLAEFLSDDDASLVTEAARAIYDEGVIEAFDALGDVTLPAEASNALARRVLAANLFTGHPKGAEHLALAVRRTDLTLAHRVEALSFLERWHAAPEVDPVTGAWRTPRHRDPALARRAGAGLGEALEKEPAPEELQIAWTKFAVILARAASAPAIERLRDWSLDASRSGTVRAAALDALTAADVPDDGAWLTELEPLALDATPDVRAAALRQLTRLAPERSLPLLEAALQGAGIAARRAAYAGFASLKSPDADARLAEELARLDAGLVPAEAQLELVEAARSRAESHAPLGTRLEARKAARSLDGALEPFLDGLFGGSPSAGAAIFRRTETSCLRCHLVPAEDGASIEGGIVGPSLVGVAERLSRLELLESIVVPNRHVADGFRNVILETTDGEILTGRVLSDAGGALRLVDAEGEEFEILLDEIETRNTGLSAMPEKLHEKVSAREMRDLLAYLGSL